MFKAKVPLVFGRIVRRHGAAVAVALAGVLVVQAFARAGENGEVPYPDGYRNWVHVKTGLISEKHPTFAQSGGFRHIYANPQALEGYRSSGTFPDGSVIVVDWIQGVDTDGAFTESGRRKIDVMVKDQQRFAATKGWGFETFKGDSRTERVVTDVNKQCFTCHSGPGTRDLVFSKLRD